MAESTNRVILVILALLLPPLGVFIQKGAGKDLAINILLCLLAWLPGVIHALWLALR